MAERQTYVSVEERLNNSGFPRSFSESKIPETAWGRLDPGLMRLIAGETEKKKKREAGGPDRGSVLYREVVIPYIKRLGDVRFLKKNGEVREAAFYEYAWIDKTTWSDFKWGKVRPSKKTILKLIFALQLGKTEALELMQLGNCKLEPEKDSQDLIISCILDYEENTGKRYTVDDVMEILDTCRNWGRESYDSIYDTPDIIAARKGKG